MDRGGIEARLHAASDRLREAGFEVYEYDYANALPPQQKELYALTDEVIYAVRKG